MIRVLKWIILLFAVNMMVYAAVVPVLFFQSPFYAEDYSNNLLDPSLEEISIKYSGGVLYGWKAGSSKDTVLLYFGGDNADSSQWIHTLHSVHPETIEKEATVLALDYPTFGKSTGIVSENSFYETANILFDYAKERYPDAAVIPMGYSIGTAAALRLVSARECAGLVLVAPMYDGTSLYLRRGGVLHAVFEPFASVKMQNDEDAVSCNVPALIFASSTDRVTKLSDINALSLLLPLSPEIYILDECEHGEYWDHEEVFKHTADYIHAINAAHHAAD